MAAVELPYLWFAQGRNAKYAFYRRDGLLIALNSPEGKRLREGDFGIEQAHAAVHARFEYDSRGNEEDLDEKIIEGSLRHGIVEFRKSPVFQENLKPHSRQAYNTAYDWLLLPPGTPQAFDNAAAANAVRPKRHRGHGHRPLASMDQEVVIALRNLRYDPPENMRSNRSRKGVFPASANLLVAALGTLSNFVKTQPRKFQLPRGWQNPTIGIEKLKGGDGHRPWEESEIDQFHKKWSVETKERAIFDILLDTGQRGIDVWGMKREHYRPRKIVSHDGTGIWTAERQIRVVQEKTGERVWVPGPDELIPVLDRLLASHNGEWFFVTRSGNRMSQGSMMKILRSAIKKVGLPHDCHPHGLRVTFATRMIEWGLGYDTIEAIVGHTTMAMAIKYTERRRKARFGVITMNRGLAAHRAGRDLIVDE